MMQYLNQQLSVAFLLFIVAASEPTVTRLDDLNAIVCDAVDGATKPPAECLCAASSTASGAISIAPGCDVCCYTTLNAEDVSCHTICSKDIREPEEKMYHAHLQSILDAYRKLQQNPHEGATAPAEVVLNADLPLTVVETAGQEADEIPLIETTATPQEIAGDTIPEECLSIEERASVMGSRIPKTEEDIEAESERNNNQIRVLGERDKEKPFFFVQRLKRKS